MPLTFTRGEIRWGGDGRTFYQMRSARVRTDRAKQEEATDPEILSAVGPGKKSWTLAWSLRIRRDLRRKEERPKTGREGRGGAFTVSYRQKNHRLREGPWEKKGGPQQWGTGISSTMLVRQKRRDVCVCRTGAFLNTAPGKEPLRSRCSKQDQKREGIAGRGSVPHG